MKKVVTRIGERKISFNRLEGINIHKNGSKVIIESSGSPIIDNEGKFRGYRGINRDITERKLAQQKIYNAVITAEEKERSRVAKELHDSVSPILSTTKLYAQTLNDFKDRKERETIMKKIGDNINDAIQSISEISSNLSPHILQNFGLVTAVRSFTDKIKETKKIKFTILSDFDDHLSENIEFTLYRVCIELINNTIKHALANEVFLNFEKKKDILLTYKDDGKGFDYEKVIQKRKGMGLFNLTNRIESLNGKITFSKKENKGIIIKIKIPLNK
jgi:signal transduction histidine kinase